MKLAPGSFLWLMKHDLVLNWRRFTEIFLKLDRRVAIALVAAAAIVAHVVAVPIAQLFLKIVAAQGESGRAMAVSGLLAGMLAWMIAQGLIGAIRIIYVRGDMELLVSSPLSAHKIFGAKALALTAESFASVAILVLPIAHAGALAGHASWLAAYPALLIVAITGTAVGLLLAMGIFWVAGPARARGVSLLIATVIASALVIGAQIWMLLSAERQDRILGAIDAMFQGSSVLDGIPMRLVISATEGNWLALGLLLVMAATLLFAAVMVLGGVFVRATLSAAGAPGRKRKRIGDAAVRFVRLRSPGGALRLKEWRLLVRDPHVFGQIALQMIYTVPVAIVLLREGNDVPMAVAPAIVVIAAQLAASIAWLTISGEDAPELISTAPCPRRDVDVAKLAAAALPVAAILALPIALLATVAPAIALMTTLFAAGSAASTALLNLWHPMPGNRRGMLRRHSQSKLIAFTEHGFAMLWAIAVVFAILGSAKAIVPIAMVFAFLALSMPGGAAVRKRIGQGIARLHWRAARARSAPTAS